jgi:magnesium-transporting ATPase (P-type)
MIAGYYYDKSWYDNFLFALALAVSVVPEGLPAAISVTLSLGMKKLLKHNVLAKKLNAVETLASVSIICSDKTGTITRNELMVTNIIVGNDEFIVDGQGYEPKGNFSQFGKIIDQKKFPILEKIMRIANLCNERALVEKNGAFGITGDPTEGALIVAAKKYDQKLQNICKMKKK